MYRRPGEKEEERWLPPNANATKLGEQRQGVDGVIRQRIDDFADAVPNPSLLRWFRTSERRARSSLSLMGIAEGRARGGASMAEKEMGSGGGRRRWSAGPTKRPRSEEGSVHGDERAIVPT